MTKSAQRWFILVVLFAVTSLLFTELGMLATLANDRQPTAAEAWQAAVQAARARDFSRAVKHAHQAERLGLTHPDLFYHRGRWNFRAGNVADSLKDFDRYVRERPQRANAQWERGITCYYAGEYRAGAQQFEDYQKYHHNDVENAVWRYLCQIKLDSKEKARAAMLPIENDPRLPMMEIYRLFRGESQPANVLQALDRKATPEIVAKEQRFDAHLYLSLYFYAHQDMVAAKKHIDLAVQQFEQGDYMWAVAVQHQRLLREISKGEAEERSPDAEP